MATRSWFWPGALAVLGVTALVVRVVYLNELRGTALFAILIGDSQQFDRLAGQILAGDWTARDLYYEAQLYPYLLALAYSVAGHDAFAVRMVQAVLGAVSCVLLAIAGERFFDRPSGLAAGSLLALYPPAIFFDGLIHKSSADLFLITFLLVAIGGCLDHPRHRWLVSAGVALGALAWNRENARLLYPVFAGWLLLWDARIPLKRRASWVAVFTLAMGAVLLPVAVRNVRLGGDFVMSTSQFGPNFYIGNHRGASGGYEPLVAGRGNALYEREDATRLAEQASGRKLTPGEVSDYWWKRTVAEIRQSPGSWLRLMARKTWLTFAATEPLDTESLEAYAASSRLLAILHWFTFGVIMALAVFGAWMTAARWRRLTVLYAMFVVMAFSVVMFFVFARYRFPLVPIAMLFAGAGVGVLLDLRRTPSRRWVPAAAVTALVAVLLHIPVRTSSDETYFNYGSELLKQGRAVESIPLLREAVRSDPAHVQARLSLGLALQQAQQNDLAIEEFREAVRLAPESPDAHVGLAIALHQEGQVQKAITSYQDAIRLKPHSAEALSNLALAFHQLGKTPEAIAHFQRAVAVEPGNVPLRMNLCRVLSDVGRTADAIACFRQAVASARRLEDVVQTEYALGQTLAGAGHAADAIASMERALAAARSMEQTEAISAIEEALLTLRGKRES